jgi:hypothetical protein
MWSDEALQSTQSTQEPYDLIELYSLFQNLPCRILKISKEFVKNRYLMRIVVQKT